MSNLGVKFFMVLFFLAGILAVSLGLDLIISHGSLIGGFLEFLIAGVSFIFAYVFKREIN